MVAPTEGHGIEEGANLDMGGVPFSLLVSQPKAKSELSRLTLTQEASLKDWEGGARNSTAADFAEALWQWYERCKKCTAIGGEPVKKNFK